MPPAVRNIALGTMLFLLGAGVAALSHAIAHAGNSRYVLAYGALIVGPVYVLVGLVQLASSSTAFRRAPALVEA